MEEKQKGGRWMPDILGKEKEKILVEKERTQ